MRKWIMGALAALALMVGAIFIAPTSAQASGAMCDGHWFTGGSSWSKACYFMGGSNAGYGQVVDTLTDGYCVDVKYNKNDGTGWHHVTNSTACTTGAIVTYYYNNILPWLRVYRGDGRYWTIINCYGSGGAEPCYYAG